MRGEKRDSYTKKGGSKERREGSERREGRGGENKRNVEVGEQLYRRVSHEGGEGRRREARVPEKSQDLEAVKKRVKSRIAAEVRPMPQMIEPRDPRPKGKTYRKAHRDPQQVGVAETGNACTVFSNTTPDTWHKTDANEI